mmetsp:Transcript_11853/g.45901  ORF Transcript_11853/g.45901 Transcript_11853/m.45901 type:complete len:296 (+) Transcript_11853:56-943(+)
MRWVLSLLDSQRRVRSQGVEQPRHPVRRHQRACDVLRELHDGDGDEAHVRRTVRLRLPLLLAPLLTPPVLTHGPGLEVLDVSPEPALHEKLRHVRDGPHAKLRDDVPDDKLGGQDPGPPGGGRRQLDPPRPRALAPHAARGEEQHVEEGPPHAPVARARRVQNLAAGVERHGKEENRREHHAHERKTLRGEDSARLEAPDAPVDVWQQHPQHDRADDHAALHVRGGVPVAHAGKRDCKHVRKRGGVFASDSLGLLHVPEPHVAVPPSEDEEGQRGGVAAGDGWPRVHAVGHERAE